MGKILAILTLILIVALLAGCKKTEPTVTGETEGETTEETTEETSEETTEETLDEEIGVIEQITEKVSESSNTSEEEPEKPDEDIMNATTVAIVTMEDLKFIPKELNISAGTTVIWQHKDEYGGKQFIKHVLTIYPPSGPGFTSKPMLFGESFNSTITQVGRYRYISVPYKNRMKGYINVE